MSAPTRALRSHGQPILPNQHPTYSHKVFIGGLPARVTLNNLIFSFSKIGTVKEISWPNAKQVTQDNAPRQGYAFVIFETAKDINALILSATTVKEKLLINIFNDSNESHAAEIKLWKHADSVLQNEQKGYGYPIELFIGGIRSGVTCKQICDTLKTRFGDVAYVKLDTCAYRYPIGTGKIRFCDEESFEKAVVLNKLTIARKATEIKPFLLRDGVKCSCDSPGKDFCVYCKTFLCSLCYKTVHFEHDSRFKESIKTLYIRYRPKVYRDETQLPSTSSADYNVTVERG